MPTVSCWLSERMSERCSLTRLNSDDTRASRDAIAPVVGTMLDVCTYTGRLPSSLSVNFGVEAKFRSTKLDWFMFSEYVPSTERLNRFDNTGPLQFRLERRLRGAAQSLANRLTLGAVLANTDPVLPSAHRDGIAAGFV